MAPAKERTLDTLRATIEPFVRGALGCQCPDEVFAHIRVLDRPASWSALPVDYVLEIGGRLLLVVCLPERWRETAVHLPELIRQGIQARDQRGLHRFRLVVPATDPDAAIEALGARFSDLAAKAPRVHLHVVGLAAVPSIGVTGGAMTKA